jgi:type I restriction enzyme M protein
VVRDGFWASTSNKQLNFLQHVKTLVAPGGRGAIVVPDNVLFEGGAGETVRRKLLHRPADEPALHAEAETRSATSTWTTSPRRNKPGARREREESERFKKFSYDELMQRDKVSLDIT